MSSPKPGSTSSSTPTRRSSRCSHVWRFDDLFSSTVLMEFDKNSDLKLDDAELEDVSKTVYDSLAEYNYFQLVTERRQGRGDDAAAAS